MSSARFKKRTTHLDIPWNFYDLYQQVVKTCPFCNSVKPRPERSRVSGLRAEEIFDIIFLVHGSSKIGDKSFGVLIVLDGATSHLTAYPGKSASPSEVIAKLDEWMDTFQMNPKAICADMAFHHPHVMHALYRTNNVQRIPTGPHTPWPNRAGMGVRLFKKFIMALVDSASKNLDQTTLAQITPAQSTRKAATVRDLKWQDARGIGHGTQTKRSPGPSFHESRTAYIHANQQDLLDEEIQKLAMTTHLEVQRREDISRDLAARMKFVPPDLRAGEHVFYWQEDPSKIQQGRKSGKWLRVEIIAIKGPMAVISTGSIIFQAHISKLRRPSDTVDLEELPDSREREGGLVLWLSCEGQIDVWEMFSDNSYLSAILDRQGLQVAAPIDLRTKKAESFLPLIPGFWHKLMKNNPKIVVMSPTVETKSFKKKEVVWQQYHLCMDVAEHQILGRKHFLILGPESGKIWWLRKVQKKFHC